MTLHIEVEEHTLDNGLRVVLAPDGRVPIVGVALYYDVGSRNEERGRSGFAHLFEHLMFEGSAHVGKSEHFQWVARFGGQVNGTTSADRTNFYESLPSSQLALGLWLEADRMRSLRVDHDNFEHQRETVMDERRQRVDNAAYGEAGVRFGELSYGCWAYAHPVIGYWEDLEAASLADVQGFYSTYYRPNNAVLAISGDLDRAEALGLAREYFGDIPAGPPPPPPDVAEPAREAEVREVLIDKRARLPAVMCNLQAPGFGDPDFFAFEVLETLLYRGPSSRLYRRMVIDEHLAVQISGGYDARRGPSLFSFSAVAPAGRSLDPAVDAWREELARIAAEPVPGEEWEKAVNQLRAGRVYALEGVLRRALSAARSALYLGDPGWENHYLDRIAEVTPGDVQRIARRWLSGPMVRLDVLPGEAA
jgi:zinc protease